MKKILLSLLFVAGIVGMHAQISFSDDFESYNPAAPGTEGMAIGTWQTFTNVFSPDGLTYFGGYPGGVAPNTGMAPNGGSGWSSINTDGVGANGGAQFLNTYSDYGNADHASGNRIESNIFQSFTIGAADLGKEYTFTFDSQLAGDPFTPDVNANNVFALQAFIKVFVPDFSSTVAFETMDISNTAWVEGNTLTVTIDPSWDGFPVQIGFLNTVTGYASSGVWYDNVSFMETPEAPIPTMGQWALFILALMITSLGVVTIRRQAIA